jgi:hypothetical protein
VSYSFLLGALLNEKLPWSGNTENAPFEPYMKTMSLPRQARDKHSETLRNGAFSAGPQEPRRFGLWTMAKSAVFYPSIIDTQPEGQVRKQSIARSFLQSFYHYIMIIIGQS